MDFTFIPSSADIGTYTITISIKDMNKYPLTSTYSLNVKVPTPKAIILPPLIPIEPEPSMSQSSGKGKTKPVIAPVSKSLYAYISKVTVKG